MDSKKDSTKKGPDATTVDLGDDLLEGTVAKPSSPSAQDQNEILEGSDDQIERVDIMIGERLFEDAKKILRQMLKKNINDPVAKEKLLEIQKLEIQDLLVLEGGRKKIISERDRVPRENTDEVLEKLERDLRLNVGANVRPVPALFPDQLTYEKYSNRVVAEAIRLSVRNRIDVGIAHLEMGLFEVAAAVFETVVRYEEQKLEGMYLLSLALIYGGKAIEATIRLEPLVRDLTMPEDHKTDFLYLMALAFERLQDLRKAREFYRRAFLLNPKYRDVTEKLNDLK